MGTQELQNGNKSIFTNIFTEIQGWEFAHRFSKRIARVQKLANERFGQKNEPFAPSLIFGERPERFAHIAHQERGNKRIAHLKKKKN